MKIEKKLEQILNEQIMHEFEAAYTYLGLSTALNDAGFPGFSHWMRKQYEEELTHAMKIIDYVQERGGSVKFQSFECPNFTLKCPCEAFKAAYDHEIKNTKYIHAAYALAQRINQATSCRADVAFLEDAQTLADLISGSDLLTNATPIGMAPATEASFLKDPSPLRSSLVVSDMVYNPRMTKLRRQAMEAGCKTIGGTSMLLWQGAEAFRLWTGKQMPVALVRERIFSGEDE